MKLFEVRAGISVFHDVSPVLSVDAPTSAVFVASSRSCLRSAYADAIKSPFADEIDYKPLVRWGMRHCGGLAVPVARL